MFFLRTPIHLAAMMLAMPTAWAAEQCPMMKDGKCPMQGGMHGNMKGGMHGNQRDMQTIHALFDEHAKVTRTVKIVPAGIEAVTESEDAKTAAKIQEHTLAMKKRLEQKQPIRMWDPLFAALFEHADKIDMQIIQTAKGVKIVETSTDPFVVKLIQSHAEGVTEFVKEGYKVMHKEHPVPAKN